ncbi:MAG: hypothetical protein WC775_01055 [Patescibacteria group bacterium]|jgi:hypothetical protein
MTVAKADLAAHIDDLPEMADLVALHEARVAELTRSLFFRLDRMAASLIGFKGGTIIEEIFRRKAPVNMDGPSDINLDGIDPVLRPFIQDWRFMCHVTTADGRKVAYSINCFRGYMNPEIMVPADNGWISFNVPVVIDPNGFARVHITRYIHDAEDQFQRAESLKTFQGNYQRGNPMYVLIKELRQKSQKSIEMHYGLPDERGDISLMDGETVVGLGHGIGRFNSRQRTVDWNHSLSRGQEPQTTTAGNTLTLNYGGTDVFAYPIQTNVYDEIRAIVGPGLLQLTGGGN